MIAFLLAMRFLTKSLQQLQQNFLELELELKLEQMQILQGLPGTCYQIWPKIWIIDTKSIFVLPKCFDYLLNCVFFLQIGTIWLWSMFSFQKTLFSSTNEMNCMHLKISFVSFINNYINQNIHLSIFFTLLLQQTLVAVLACVLGWVLSQLLS